MCTTCERCGWRSLTILCQAASDAASHLCLCPACLAGELEDARARGQDLIVASSDPSRKTILGGDSPL